MTCLMSMYKLGWRHDAKMQISLLFINKDKVAAPGTRKCSNEWQIQQREMMFSILSMQIIHNQIFSTSAVMVIGPIIQQIMTH